VITLHPLALVGLILVAAWLAGWVAGRMVLAKMTKLVDLMAEGPADSAFIEGPSIEHKKERLN